MSRQVSVGMIIRYASHNLKFIYSIQHKVHKECPTVSTGESRRKRVHTLSESHDIPLSPQIRTARHTSSVLKSLKTQSDKATSKGELNPLQESRGGEAT